MSTYTATTVPTQFVEANGIRFAYRRWGKRSGLPLVFNQHFTGNLDNWDPAVLDGLAKEREVIIFNFAPPTTHRRTCGSEFFLLIRRRVKRLAEPNGYQSQQIAISATDSK
jgi:hypothetical protein